MTVIEAGPFVDELRCLKRFPREAAAVKAIVKLFADNARDGTHAERIVAGMLSAHSEWPGPSSLVTVAASVSPAEEHSRSAAAGDMAAWKREYFDRVLGGLCQDCNGFGILSTESGRLEACGCPEGRARWIRRDTGQPCLPDEPGAVFYNSDEWLDRWNRALAKKGRQAPFLKPKDAKDTGPEGMADFFPRKKKTGTEMPPGSASGAA